MAGTRSHRMSFRFAISPIVVDTPFLQSTVLLTANVAFLAIPSVDNPLGTLRNPAQVTSFVSMVFSMGCMVSGQLLVRHHMLRPHDSADQVVRSPTPSWGKLAV